MMTRADRIHELPQKIKEVSRLLHEEGKIGKATREYLADYCGIKFDTLKSCLFHEKLSMTPELQLKLADKVGFSVDDRSWIDRHASGAGERKDTAAHFREMLLRTRAAAKPLRLNSVAPKPRDRNLATFEVTDTQEGSTDGISVILESYFRPGVDGQTVYGFKRIRLEFSLDENGRSAADQRLGLPQALALGNARLKCWGPPHQPEWLLEVDEAFLEGSYTTHDDPLFKLKNAALGEVLKVRMMVQLRDRDVVVNYNDRPVGKRVKEAVLDRLRAVLLYPDDPEPHGWIELGVQEIEIVEASS